MTDTTDQTTTADTTRDLRPSTNVEAEAPEATIAPPEPDDPDDGDQEPDEGHGNEAAKYRRRLRSTEHERDQLAAQVERLQRAEVDRLAAADNIEPRALWAAGVELSSLLTEDGTVDTEAVAKAIDEARTALGIPRSRTPRPNTVQGRSEGRRLGVGSSWQAAFERQGG